MILIYAVILAYAFLLPRKNIDIPPVEVYIIEESSPTFVVEDPSWVKPLVVEHSVTVTVYHAVESQTDDTPHILADGTVIDINRAGEYRYCALSRDLLERWHGPYSYGDVIHLEGAGAFSGKWIVKDTMNKRFTNRVDLLVDASSGLHKYESAKIRKVM